jgi:hypothetical protein
MRNPVKFLFHLLYEASVNENIRPVNHNNPLRSGYEEYTGSFIAFSRLSGANMQIASFVIIC